VVSVTSLAEVNQWSEADDEDTQHLLYWRQVLNVHTLQPHFAVIGKKDLFECTMPLV
jgi:hypothetical protein